MINVICDPVFIYLHSNIGKQENGRAEEEEALCASSEAKFWYKQKCEGAWLQRGKIITYLFLMWQALMPVLLICTIWDQEDCFQKEALN